MYSRQIRECRTVSHNSSTIGVREWPAGAGQSSSDTNCSSSQGLRAAVRPARQWTCVKCQSLRGCVAKVSCCSTQQQHNRSER